MSQENAAAAVLPVLNKVIEFMEDALKQSSSDQDRIKELTVGLTKLQSEQERIILEKVASAKATFFDKAALDAALAKLEGMGVIDSNNHEKLARRIAEDPGLVLPLIVKVAETLMSAPGEGSGVTKEASMLDTSNDDPDGWHAMAEGRTVTIHK